MKKAIPQSAEDHSNGGWMNGGSDLENINFETLSLKEFLQINIKHGYKKQI